MVNTSSYQTNSPDATHSTVLSWHLPSYLYHRSMLKTQSQQLQPIVYNDTLPGSSFYSTWIRTLYNCLPHFDCHIVWAASSSNIGIPNIRNLNCIAWISTQTFRAMNSDPNALVSTVCCLLEYHIVGVQFMNIMKPEWDLRVFLLAACDVSTNAVTVTGRPWGFGCWCGISFCASL